jgi:hypothetical protein
MVVSSVVLGTMNHCAGEAQQQFSSQSSSVIASQQPSSEDVSTKAEEYLWLGAVTRQITRKTLTTLYVLQSVYSSEKFMVICSYVV